VDAARTLLLRAIADRIFPAAVSEVGDSRHALWREAFGTLAFDDRRHASESTIFDLASLTKPVATATIILDLAGAGGVDLAEPLTQCFAEWRGVDRERATVQDLLEHASGLAARLVDPPPRSRREFEHEICSLRLEYAPRSKSIYSDLGFILLGFLAADRGGAPLDTLFERIMSRVAAAAANAIDPEPPSLLGFGIPESVRDRTAPTEPLAEDVRRGRRLVGDVHDNYAAALGGVAGHAGLFGTAAGVGRFARATLRAARGDTTVRAPLSPALVAHATTKTTVAGSSRALGWDTMLPTSSCGTKLSKSAFGHVGFTGTSLWIDPPRDRYYVLLTNRVCGGGTEADIKEVRRAFHDAVAEL
jgi:CubicO group peptidase (beta-lactamase class C family)